MMKKWKNLSARGFALFLALIMCLSTMQLTAFAEDEIADGDEPVKITASEGAALIPEDAATETNTITGGNTTVTDTNTSWESTTETPGEYGEITTTGDADIVDKLTGGDDLDNIEDGSYTKVETQTKQDVTVTIEGEQNRTDTGTVDELGRPIQDGFMLDGEQTTTTIITDTTKTTTTEVNKETEVGEVTEDIGEEIITDGEETTEVTDGDKTDTNTPEGELDKVKVNLGNDLFTDNNISSGELTVSGSNTTASSGSQAATSVNTDAVTRDLLTALDGWTVTAGGKSATVKVDENGKVSYVDADGNPVEDFKVTLVPNQNGTYSIQAQKVTTTITEGESSTTSDKGDNTKGDAEEINWSEYELVETVTNEDGSVTEKYVKTGTADRTDTNAWTEVTTRVDGVKVVTQSVTVSATLTNGSYTVTAGWAGVTDQSNGDNGDVLIQVLGPSGTVIGYAITSRNKPNQKPTQHLIIANDYKDSSKDSLAANNTAVDTSSLTLVGGILQSTVLINDATGKSDYTASPWLRMMTDANGNYFYVYCAEHGKTDYSGTEYDIVNVYEHALYGENANHIQYVVENGWWGTDSGAGSLTEVKKLVSSTNADYLDEGIALAVTQAAIWYYTAGASNKINETDTFTTAWKNGYASGYDTLSKKQQAAAMELFYALIQKDKTNEQMASQVKDTTDFIHEDDIVSTSVQVVNKVDVNSVDDLTKMIQNSLIESDQAKGNASGMDINNVYQADVSITLAVIPSKLNSNDLVVYVYSGTTLVGSKRISEADLQKDGGKVTIENVVLQSGATVRFHLEGTQNLNAGAYLFNALDDYGNTKSQTMVGYVNGSTATHNVNLDVNMTFSVTENNAQATSNAAVSGTTTTYDQTYTTTSEKTSTTDVTEHHTTTVTVTTQVTVTEDPVETPIVERVIWNDAAFNTYSYTSNIPGDDDDDDDVYYPGDDDDDVYIPSDDDDDDDVTVPDAPTPLTDTPAEISEAPVEITDAPTPLTEAPVENTEQPEEDLELPDTLIPLVDMPAEEEPVEEEELELPDGDIPLIDVPVTGDSSAIWYAMAALAVLGLMILTVLGRKREEEQR